MLTEDHMNSHLLGDEINLTYNWAIKIMIIVLSYDAAAMMGFGVRA